MLCIIFIIPLSKETAFALDYFIERPALGLDLSYEFDNVKRTGPFSNIDNSASTFSERFDIETNGWFYHPALLIYTLKLSPEWEQLSKTNIKSTRRTSRTFLEGYSAEFTFLQYKPYTLKIFAERHTSTITSSSAEISKKKFDTYGAKLTLKYSILPTILYYNHEKSRQTGFFSTDTMRDELYLTSKYDKHLGATRLETSYIDNTRTTLGRTMNTTTLNARLHNSYDFTDKRAILNSSLSYNNVQGDFTKITGYNIIENLFLRHRKNLSTSYTFHYDLTDMEPFKRKESRGLDFKLIHRLYENLTTSVNADGTANQFAGGKEVSYGTRLEFDYNRAIPWGILNINTGHAYRIVNNSIKSDNIPVIESPTLNDDNIVLLKNEHVNIISIKVLNESGTPYMEHFDYELVEIGSFAGIRRIPGSSISDGQKVFVQYEFLSNPAFDYSTFEQSYGINLNLWSAWRIYYTFTRNKQSFISGIQPDNLVDDNIHLARTELDWKWSKTVLEFNDRQTTNLPSKSWRAGETVTVKPEENIFVSISGSYGKTRFKELGETEKATSIRTIMQMLISNWSRLSVEGFRYEISRPSYHTMRSGFLSLFEWAYAIYGGSVSYRFTNEKDKISNETFKRHYLLFEVKRALF